MATSQTETGSQLIELSTESLDTFCNDIAAMFEVNIVCTQQQICTETVKGLKERFKNLAAVNSVKAEGLLDGAFHLVFDREGLFTLAGVVLMQPEQEIRNNIETASLEKAKIMNDVFTEVGLTLVGAWDRVSQKKLDGNNSFVQTSTFIGNPWDKSEQKIGLPGNEKFMFVPYQLTIEPYPAFQCGVIFPKITFTGEPIDISELTKAAEEKPQEEKQDETDPTEKTESKDSDTAQEGDSDKSESQEPAAQETHTNNAADKEENEEQAETDETAALKQKPEKKKTAATKKTASKHTKKEKTDKDKNQPISETIQKMKQSAAVLPGEKTFTPPTAEKQALNSTDAFLAILAKDIMQENIIWAGPDESVQQALTKMQQHNSGYIMIGTDEVLHGIVSKSDIAGAISPYLKPAFEKWRRPLDDATLQIKLKWIMSKPVHTTKLETSLIAVIEDMYRIGWRALPVADQQEKVQGLITVFDIFKALLYSNPNFSASAKAD
ncbi:MAG: CBS domain-containing protein [Planctomycetota bacterium]|jgi:CBS domain-containing protein